MVFDGTPRLGSELPDPRQMTDVVARTLDAAIGEVDWAVAPASVERLRHQVPSGVLAGLASGDPAHPRIVMVPGVTGSKEDFALMVPLLVRAGYRAEGIDLAGQYESHQAGPERLTPPRTRYDWDLFVDDLVAVLRAGPTPAHLLGYSFAGTVAQLVAIRHPELVASLTLLGTPPISGQVYRRLSGFGGLGALVSHFTTARQTAGIFLWGLRKNLNHVNDARYRFVQDRLLLTRRDSIDDIQRLMRRTPNVASEVAALAIPKLVAFGAKDTWAPELHHAYAKRIGALSAQYETGHSPCETTPHQFVRDMLAVIEDRVVLPE